MFTSRAIHNFGARQRLAIQFGHMASPSAFFRERILAGFHPVSRAASCGQCRVDRGEIIGPVSISSDNLQPGIDAIFPTNSRATNVAVKNNPVIATVASLQNDAGKLAAQAADRGLGKVVNTDFRTVRGFGIAFFCGERNAQIAQFQPLATGIGHHQGTDAQPLQPLFERILSRLLNHQ